MTDKEPVMIKGIDVSKCRYFCIYDETCRDENIGHIVRPACKNVPDCYFKQLARKAQECESLNKRASSLEEIADDLQQRNHHLTQECEELKAYAQRQENQREEYYKEYQKLKQDLLLKIK